MRLMRHDINDRINTLTWKISMLKYFMLAAALFFLIMAVSIYNMRTPLLDNAIAFAFHVIMVAVSYAGHKVCLRCERALSFRMDHAREDAKEAPYFLKKYFWVVAFCIAHYAYFYWLPASLGAGKVWVAAAICLVLIPIFNGVWGLYALGRLFHHPDIKAGFRFGISKSTTDTSFYYVFTTFVAVLALWILGLIWWLNGSPNLFPTE
ncbi:MAG: hypothetical protein Q4B68_06885 [Bacteroidales bacterium]|nr:hypothetical protein [Bacteroidales bacterium]